MQDQIEALENLAAIDTELRELQTELTGERGTLATKRQNLDEIDEKLVRSRRSVEDMDKLRGELTGEVRQMSVQIEKSREKLSRCRTEREVNAAQREVEELRKLFRDRELEIEKLAALSDQAKIEIEGLASKQSEIAQELGTNEGQTVSRLGDLDRRVSELTEARKKFVGKLPGQLLRRYDQVMKRKGSAVAHTTDGTCSACHMMLPPQMFQQLLRGTEFQACPHCVRIIYFRPPSPADGSDHSANNSAGSP